MYRRSDANRSNHVWHRSVWLNLFPQSCSSVQDILNPMNMFEKEATKNRLKQKFSELEFPNFDRLDVENAQFWPEHRIPHAKLYM